MPINTDLNVDPYFDDYNLEKQFYKILFKPSYPVQARELTQLQTTLQNQIEQFGDNIFQEGSIINGCNFTELDELKFVKLGDKTGFDISKYIGFDDTVTVLGEEYVRTNSYELRGSVSGISASVVAAVSGFETRNPDLNTFFIDYTSTAGTNKQFQTGELLEIYKISTVEVGSGVDKTETLVDSINVTSFVGAVGNSFGLRSAPGVIYQRGHFLYAEEQLIIVSKYNNIPTGISIGYEVQEKIIDSFTDRSLLDNANGSFNQNAPGADRLKLIPVLKSLTNAQAANNADFFSLVRYSDGNQVVLRNVSQYNVLGDEMARRTFEESGDYTVSGFKPNLVRKNGVLTATISPGLAYIKGYRVETAAEIFKPIDEIANTSIGQRTNQPISFNYGSYAKTTNSSASGTVDIGTFGTVQLKDHDGDAAGTARVRNITNDKIFLFDIRVLPGQTFSDVEEVVGSSGSIPISNNSVIQDASKSAMIFDSGMTSLNSLSNISIPVRAQRALSGLSSTTVVLSPNAGEDFVVNNDDALFVDATNTRIDILNNSLAGSLLNLTLSSTPSATGTLYHNKRIQNASPFTKTSETLYVKCDFANPPITSANSIYNLGFPDVYEIVTITDSLGNDVTSSFKLKTNQRDNFYGHSYIEFIPGRTIPAPGDMTVEMNAFKLGDTTGNYFFNINSYPVSFAKNKLQPYISASGDTYNLRNCLDFRPYAEPLSPATYTNAASVGTAPSVSDSTTGVNVPPVFSGSYEILTPAYNQTGDVDYQYYFARKDIVVMDSFSRISVIKGTESENPFPETTPKDQLKIAEIFIPGKPALSPSEAYAQNRIDYSATIKQTGTRGYDMKAIENIEQKVDQLRYYVLLSTLEADTKNLNITDENGLSRFKNGIIVDPFNDLTIANLENVEYNAAIDFTEKSLMPSVKSFPINLKLKSVSNATVFPNATNPILGSLQRDSDVEIISQPYATGFRNCVSNFYNYFGTGTLVPEYDALYDTVTNPLNIDIDITTPMTQLVDAIQEFIPLTSTLTENLGTVRTGTRRTGTTATTRFRDTVSNIQLSGENVNEQKVGDFVTNFSFNPYMKSREVNVFMSGLRPNTRHYFFFDEDDVNAHIYPAQGSPGDVNNPNSFTRSGVIASAVTSDGNGIVRAIFKIPEGTFFVGDRKLEIVDVDTYASINSAKTSYGSLVYRAYNFSVEKSSLSVSTRSPSNFIQTTTTERTVTRRTAPIPDNDNGVNTDPLSQTFFIKTGMGRGSDTVFISKLDIFFKRKSTLNGLLVDIREVINGYPSNVSVPLSDVHLNPSEIGVSDDASVATTVTFKSPIRLDAEKEYAFVVKPDANDPDYLLFTSKVGGKNLSPGATQGLTIVQDWGDGVLFTSTNNRAWKSYQDEDVKFTLHRHNFGANTGSITLTNDDNEFFTTVNNVGRFEVGEFVYTNEILIGSTTASVSVTAGSNIITGTSLSDTYSAGDYILLDDGSTNKQILKVVSSTTSTITADRNAFFTASINSNPITVGVISHYDFRYPTAMILERSSAISTRKFEAGDTINGFDSGSTAEIVSVDNKKISYIQPMITRTNDIASSTTLAGTFANSTTGAAYNQNVAFNDKTLFAENGIAIHSKSNDIAGAKSLNLTISLANGSNATSSPMVDIETAAVLASEWQITNDSNTTAKYISKTVELSENLDAEDFTLLATAYRPSGTDIKVFIKPQSVDDASVFDTNDWIELELSEGINLYSSISNVNDFKEFTYKVKDTDKNASEVLTYTNNISTFEGYRRFAIKIELHSENIFKAPRLLDYRGISLT
jgi:hypothetical protein